MNAARRIVRAVGTEGLIARFGGDEFLVVCSTEDDEDRPERVADAILDAFGDSFRFEKAEFAITASIGIARAPEHGNRPQTLIHSAAAAVYDRKRRIRHRWPVVTPTLAHPHQARAPPGTHHLRAT